LSLLSGDGWFFASVGRVNRGVDFLTPSDGSTVVVVLPAVVDRRQFGVHMW
jgi:hypothetical protein